MREANWKKKKNRREGREGRIKADLLISYSHILIQEEERRRQFERQREEEDRRQREELERLAREREAAEREALRRYAYRDLWFMRQ